MTSNLKTRLQRIERKSKPAERYITAIQDLHNPGVYRIPENCSEIFGGREVTRQELERMEKDGITVCLVEYEYKPRGENV